MRPAVEILIWFEGVVCFGCVEPVVLVVAVVAESPVEVVEFIVVELIIERGGRVLATEARYAAKACPSVFRWSPPDLPLDL